MEPYDLQFITLRIKSFAILREIIGKEQMTVQLPRKDEGTSVADLRKKICELYPKISTQNIPFGIAVNAKVADERLIIKESDEIALLPPISGGG